MGDALRAPGHVVNVDRGRVSSRQENAAVQSVHAVRPGAEQVPFPIRFLEIAIASAALIATLPVMALLAVLILRGTPGPILFRQQRIGVNCKPFTFMKFRTHYADSKQRFPKWCDYNFAHDQVSEVRLQIEDDPRVTPQGKWLRRTSLDELPNFWHVLTGEMALVGPRPEMVEMLPYYKGEALLKFSVRPGITGYAQIYGRGDLKFHETVAYDLQYVREKSFRTDCRVILKTIRMIISGAGAY